MSLCVVANIILSSDPVANAKPLRVRRRVRRRIVRRRFRRAAVTRIIRGRPFWVVPVGLALGWELVHDRRVVIVKEIKIVEKDGARTEVAIVEDNGKREEIAILREDTPQNRKELEGSVLPDDDKTTPGSSVEIEEEVDE